MIMNQNNALNVWSLPVTFTFKTIFVNLGFVKNVFNTKREFQTTRAGLSKNIIVIMVIY